MPSAISQPSNTVHTASSTSPVRSEPTELPSTFCVLMLRMRIGVRAVVKLIRFTAAMPMTSMAIRIIRRVCCRSPVLK